MVKKRMIAGVLLLALALALFSGCSVQKSMLIGTWTLQYVLVDGEEEYLPMSVSFTFNGDGTGYVAASSGSESIRNGLKWMLDEDTLILAVGEEENWSDPDYWKILSLTPSELRLGSSSEDEAVVIFTR